MSSAGLTRPLAAPRAGRPGKWLEPWRQEPRLLISAVLFVILAGLMLPPLWILVQDSVTTTNAAGDVTGWTLGHFVKLGQNDRALVSFWNSMVFSAGSTVLSVRGGRAPITSVALIGSVSTAASVSLRASVPR